MRLFFTALLTILLLLPSSPLLSFPPQKRRRTNLTQATDLPKLTQPQLTQDQEASTSNALNKTISDLQKEVAEKKEYIEAQMDIEALGYSREEALEHIARYKKENPDFSPRAQLLAELVTEKLPSCFSGSRLSKDIALLKKDNIRIKELFIKELFEAGVDVMQAFSLYKSNRFFNEALTHYIPAGVWLPEYIKYIEALLKIPGVNVNVPIKHYDMYVDSLEGYWPTSLLYIEEMVDDRYFSENVRANARNIAQLLKQHGASTHIDAKGIKRINKIIGELVYNDCFRSLKKLLAIPGVNVNAPVILNNHTVYPTLLDCAMSRNQRDIEELLRAHGAIENKYFYGI